jgi:hypothetical protein
MSQPASHEVTEAFHYRDIQQHLPDTHTDTETDNTQAGKATARPSGGQHTVGSHQKGNLTGRG